MKRKKKFLEQKIERLTRQLNSVGKILKSLTEETDPIEEEQKYYEKFEHDKKDKDYIG